MTSREALLSALAAVAFGAAAGAAPAQAAVDPSAVGNQITTATGADDLRRHLGDADFGAPAVARLMELQGLVQVAQATGDPNLQLCLYKPDDPRYRLDPRCPPLGISPSSSGSDSSGGGGGGYPG
jgi:hypothetical protein